MRRALLLILGLAAFRSEGQLLVCPPSTATSGKPCDVFHYHVQFYEPETKGFTTLYGINQYSSMAACDRARDARVKQNAAVVDYIKRIKAQPYEADRIGPCHCDMTLQTTSATFLSEAQRLVQKRTAEDVRRRVRDKLLDEDASADSELITGLTIVTQVNPMLAGPRLTQLPAPVSIAVENRAADLRMPKATQTSMPAAAAIDLPLADIPLGEAGAAAAASTPAPAPRPAEAATAKKPAPASGEAPVNLTAVEVAIPAESAVETPPATERVPAAVVPKPEAEEGAPAPAAPDDQSMVSAEDAADVFIRYEIQRIQNVMHAIPDPPDETGEKVIDACRLRSQVLTNLKYLIIGSGARSAIAAAARRTADEASRLDLVKRLFGEGIAAHWVPRVTTDVLIAADPAIDENPERVLRDSSGQHTPEQKRRALYAVLTRETITEDQQLWLITAVEQFLQ